MEEDGRTRLRQLVRERRTALGLSVRAAARNAGIDRDTWADMESGSRILRDYNYASVERALRWKPGSVDAVLAGGQATIEPELARDIDEEVELVRRDARLTPAMKVRIIRLIHERREREKAAGLAETRSIIEALRDAG